MFKSLFNKKHTFADFGDGVVGIKNTEGKWGLFSVPKERMIVPFQFDSIAKCESGGTFDVQFLTNVYVVENNGGLGVYSVDEQRLEVPTCFSKVSEFGGVYCVRTKDSKGLGLYSGRDDKLILPMEYSTFSLMNNREYVAVWKDGKVALFSLETRSLVTEPRYDKIRFDGTRFRLQIDTSGNPHYSYFDPITGAIQTT